MISSRQREVQGKINRAYARLLDAITLLNFLLHIILHIADFLQKEHTHVALILRTAERKILLCMRLWQHQDLGG